MIVFSLLLIDLDLLFFFAMNLYSSNGLFFKIILLIMLFVIVIQFIKKDFKNPVINRYPFRYGLVTWLDHLVNLFFIILYILILGFLWWRFYNSMKVIDLIFCKDRLWGVILNTSLIENIINALIIFSIIFLYLIFLIRLNYYFKFQLIRRHLFHLRFDAPKGVPESRYEQILKHLNYHLNLRVFFVTLGQYSLKLIFYPLSYIKNYKYLNPLPLIKYFLWVDQYPDVLEVDCTHNQFYRLSHVLIKDYLLYLNYFILILTFLYDIFYNNLIIEQVYKILPYVFLYNLYAKFSKFILCRSQMNDGILNSFIYYEVKLDEDGDFITVSCTVPRHEFREFLSAYLLKDLQDYQLKEIYFGKRFYEEIVHPIRQQLEGNYWDFRKYFRNHSPITLLDVIFLIETLILLQSIINKLS